MINYGLRLKGRESLLKYRVIEIKGLDGVTQVYELGEAGLNDWLLEDVEDINNALREKTPWYNTSFCKPQINFLISNLEIVKVDKTAHVQEEDIVSRAGEESVLSIFEKLNDEDDYEVEDTETKSISKEEIANQIIEQLGDSVDSHSNESPSIHNPSGFKLKVECLKSIPKEMGSVRYESDPVSNCFIAGKVYLAYIKNQKLYGMNEDKIPEYICNATDDSDWEENFFFKSHFKVLELMDSKTPD